MGRVETPPDLNGNRQASPLNNVIASTTLATAATILRLITRIWVVRQVGWDDYTIIAADLGHILGFILVFVELHYGFGWPGSTISPEYFREFERYSYAEWIQTFQTLMFTKSSICFFLLRIHINKEYIRPIQVTIVGLVVSNLILTFLWIFQCSPVEAAWDKRKLDAGLDGQNSGYCMTNGQLERIILSQALVSIISDFMLALFPVLLLWKVQISLRTKFGLWGLMALGLATATLCIIRTVFNWQNVNDHPTWKSDMNLYYRTWEVGTGITAACIPALRPGYKALRNRVSTYYSTHYGSVSHTGGSRFRSASGRHQSRDYDGRRDALVGSHMRGQSSSKGDELLEMTDLAHELTRPGAAVQYDAVVHGPSHLKNAGDDGIMVDMETGNEEIEGIKKTMWFGTKSDQDLRVGRHVERGERGRGFI